MAHGSNQECSSARQAIAVVGAKGLLGSALMRRLAATPAVRAVGLDREECDIGDAESIRSALAIARPHIVINCAAFTQVDACESQEETAYRVNAVGAGNVSAAARELGAKIVHVSTDYVFDVHQKMPIREDAPTGPADVLSAYGRSKLEGERRTLAGHPDAVIVRSAWMYDRQGAGFPNAILNQAREKKSLRVVDDQTGSPTCAEDLAAALMRIASVESRGLYHVTNAGHCTWYEFAFEIVRLAGLTDVSIKPVPTAEFPRPARRPAYSVLDNSRFDHEVGPRLRHWRDAIAECIAHLLKDQSRDEAAVASPQQAVTEYSRPSV